MGKFQGGGLFGGGCMAEKFSFRGGRMVLKVGATQNCYSNSLHIKTLFSHTFIYQGMYAVEVHVVLIRIIEIQLGCL